MITKINQLIEDIDKLNIYEKVDAINLLKIELKKNKSVYDGAG